MDNNSNKAENVQKTQENKPATAQKPAKKPATNSDFKRKYFDFYDDIKISDRQDW
jgi:hypothetical protein